MSRNIHFILIALFVLFISVFVSCVQLDNNTDTNTDSSSSGEETDVSGGSEEIDNLFEEDGGSVIINVNNESYWSSKGYTLWKVLDDSMPVSDGDYSVTVSKSSGTEEAGYGIVFGQTENAFYGNCLLVVLVNTEGEFTVGELLNTTYYTLKSWTANACIKSGYNVNNTIKVSYEKNHYDIYINDEKLYTLYSNYVNYSGAASGKNGFILVISPKDDLPNYTVSVAYRVN